MAAVRKNTVQVYNPRIERWVLVDKVTGRIITNKKSPGSYKDVPKHQSSKKISKKK